MFRKTMHLTTTIECDVCGRTLEHSRYFDADVLSAEVVGVELALNRAWDESRTEIMRDMKPRAWHSFGNRWVCPEQDRAHGAFKRVLDGEAP